MKKRQVRLITGLLVCILCLTGCTRFQIPELTKQKIEDPISEIPEVVYEPIEESVHVEETFAEASSEQETFEIEETEVEEAPLGERSSSDVTEQQLQEERKLIGLDEESIQGLLAEESGKYYFQQCSSWDRQLYVEIYQILLKHGENILISGKDVDALTKAYQCVINDHPELFYLCGYTYTKHTMGGELKFLTFSGRYLYTASEIESRRQKIEAAVSKILAAVPTGADEYTKVKLIYEFLIFNTDYSTASADNQNICSVFLDRTSVCNGYAKAAQYLLERLGIKCLIVNGTAGGGAHAWNIVSVDGQYYHLDTTWGDPSYHNDDTAGGATPDIDYSYLNITSEQILKNHQIDRTFLVPQCDSVTANYFVREGLLFDSLDENRLTAVFKEAEDSGANIVTIQAANSEIYLELYDYLLTQQKIFHYYKAYDENGNYTIAYSNNDQLYTLSFWK